MSHGLNPIEPRGGSEKLDMSTALGRLNCMARSQHPFCESLRIHENEIARGHAKTVSQSESINSEKGMPKMGGGGQSKQQGAPRILTEVNYY